MVERLVGARSPTARVRTRAVQPFGERLGEPVGDRLQHQRRVVVALRPRTRRACARCRVPPSPRTRRRSRAPPDAARRSRRGTSCGLPGGPRGLLAQVVPDERGRRARLVGPQHDVVAARVRRPEADDAVRREPAPVDRRASSIACPSANTVRADSPTTGSSRIAGIRARELPRLEERRPVDAAPRSSRGRRCASPAGRGTSAPAARRPHQSMRERVRARLRERDELSGPSSARAARGCARSRPRPPRRRRARCSSRQQARRHADRARRVRHVDDRARRSAARSSPPCARATSSRRRSGAAARSPRAASRAATCAISSSDGVISPDSPIASAFCSRAACEDLLRRHHDAEVDDVEVVALEHDADDVLADVVHVALDRRHARSCPSTARRSPERRFSASMNGTRCATACFITRALFTTCGRNILPAPKRSPTTFMPSISGPSITSIGRPPRAAIASARLLGVLDDEARDALDQRVRQPRLDRLVAPREVLVRRPSPCAL